MVVGFDGSSTALLALDWGADTAAAYGTELTVLRARPDAESEVRIVEREGIASAFDAPGVELMHLAAERVAASHPNLSVRFAAHPQSPVDALLEASSTAELIVIGSRGLEGFAGLLLGSTVMNVAPFAECPVVVLYQPDDNVLAESKHPREVVVGFDGSESAIEALRFALRHAEAFGFGVAVVVVTKGGGEENADEEGAQGKVDPELEELLRSAAEVTRDSRAPVSYVHASGRPAGALIAEAAGCPLAVVGARGRGGLKGLLLGSVGLQMLMHAESPVAIVHARES